MPVHFLEDATKRPYPDAMPAPGGTTILSVTSAAIVTFEPSLIEETAYYLYTTGNVRFAVHNADYAFDPAENAVLLPGDVRLIKLGDAAGRWVTVSLQAVVGTVDVTIEQLQ